MRGGTLPENSLAKPKSKLRDAKFELLRIVSMLMIVCLHLFGYTEFATQTTGANYVILKSLHTASMVAVNMFVMISCYFLVNKKTSYKKILALTIEVIFYSVLFYVIFISCGWKTFEIKDLLYFAPFTGVYWFFSAYLILYLAVPFLNILLAQISKKQHLLLLVGLMCIAMLNFLPTGMKVFDFNLGFSAIWFMTIFIFMYYIKKYNVKEFKAWVYILTYIITIIISYFAGAAYCSPFIALASYSFFMIFKKINIKNAILTKIICFVSAETFAVYLIFSHPLVHEVLYNKILHCQLFATNKFAVLIFIGFNFAIFAACIIIDIFRKFLFKFIGFLYKKVKNKKQSEIDINKVSL